MIELSPMLREALLDGTYTSYDPALGGPWSENSSVHLLPQDRGGEGCTPAV